MQETLGTLVLLLSFAVIIVSIKFRLHLSIAIFLGAVVLYGAYGFGIFDSSLGIFNSLKAWDSLRLLALIFLVIFMSRLMKVAGTLTKISDSLKRAFSDARVSYGAIPAIIGLLPMPAGALISAQMVNKAADELERSAEERTFVNYWFRHVWEFSWPFYQGVILTAATLAITVRDVVFLLFPITVISILVGYYFGIRPVKRQGDGEKDMNGLKEFVWVLWPVWFVIAVSIGAGMDLVYALVITDLLMLVVYRLDAKKLKEALRESLNPNIFLIIIAIVIFKGSLELTGAVSALPAFMSMYGIPAIAVVVVLPMFVGIISGLTVAFVGISFPILLPMLAPGGFVSPAMLALAYLSGFIGVLLSPLHLCLIFSADYFKAELPKVYRRLYLPLLALFVLGAGYSMMLYLF